MYRPLVPCPECARHVRRSEEACPFCSATLDDVARSRVAPDTRQRLARAAAFAFGASVVVACGGAAVKDDLPGNGGGDSAAQGSGGAGGDVGDAGGAMALYGAPAVGGADGGTGGDVGDAGGAMAEYGAPPPPEDD